MSNWGNGNHGGPSFSFWRVMLVGLGVLALAWLFTILVFGDGSTP